MFEKDKCNIFFVAPPFPNGRPVVLWPLRSAVLRQARPVHTQPLSPLPCLCYDRCQGLRRRSCQGWEDFAEIQDTVKKAYGDKALKRTQIYDIIRKVKAGENANDQRYRNPKKTKTDQSLIMAVATAVEKDRRVTIDDLAVANGVSHGTIYNILHDELGIEKSKPDGYPNFSLTFKNRRECRSAESSSLPCTATPWRCWTGSSLWTRLWCPTIHLKRRGSQNSGLLRANQALSRPGSTRARPNRWCWPFLTRRASSTVTLCPEAPPSMRPTS